MFRREKKSRLARFCSTLPARSLSESSHSLGFFPTPSSHVSWFASTGKKKRSFELTLARRPTAEGSAAASALMQTLLSAPDARAAGAAASGVADFVLNAGIRSLAVDGILEDLLRATKSKDAPVRLAALTAYEELFRKVGLAGGADPFFIPLLPVVLDRYQESGKAENIKVAAEKAAKALIRIAPAELAPKIIEELFAVIEGGAKWRSKVGALELLATFAVSAKDQVAERLGEYVPRLSLAMRDTKPEVRSFIHVLESLADS